MHQGQLAFSDYSSLETGPLPIVIDPMLPTVVSDPFDSDDHIFEFLLDGVRAIALVEGDTVRLHDRYLQDITHRYPELTSISKSLGAKNVALDGMIMALDSEGQADFKRLSRRFVVEEGVALRRLVKKVPLIYQAFDILWWDGRPVTSLQQWRRKQLLDEIIKPNSVVRVQEYVEKKGIAFLEKARENSAIGVIAKERSGLYYPGERSRSWLSQVLSQRGDFIIGGYTFGGPRWGKKGDPIASLLLGRYNGGGQLEYVGEVAGGFDRRLAISLQRALGAIQGTCPFVEPPTRPRLTFWCRPELVCRVNYGEISRDGMVRFPVFVSLRPDVPVASCRLNED